MSKQTSIDFYYTFCDNIRANSTEDYTEVVDNNNDDVMVIDANSCNTAGAGNSKDRNGEKVEIKNCDKDRAKMGAEKKLMIRSQKMTKKRAMKGKKRMKSEIRCLEISARPMRQSL